MESELTTRAATGEPQPEPRHDPVRGEPGVSVVIPTYREVENLPVLIPRVAAAVARVGLAGEILVVDDGSDDGTELACKELADTYPVRLVVRRTERGLSSAVVHGLDLARGRFLVVMDADLSHPPEKIPELVGMLRAGRAEFVIGSRYVRGGGLAQDWGWLRRLNSSVATWLARPLTAARDPMAGFFALHRATFERARSRLDPIGYKIGLELIIKSGCRAIDEVPIHFTERQFGRSKLGLREQVNYLRHLGRLYAYRCATLAQPVRFLIVGGTGAAVDLVAFSTLLTFWPGAAARAGAIWVAMTWNYTLNRRLTFPEGRLYPVHGQYLLFCLASLAGAGVNWLVSVGLYESVPFFTRWPLLAGALGIVGGSVFNFLGSKFVAFR